MERGASPQRQAVGYMGVRSNPGRQREGDRTRCQEDHRGEGWKIGKVLRSMSGRRNMGKEGYSEEREGRICENTLYNHLRRHRELKQTLTLASFGLRKASYTAAGPNPVRDFTEAL